MPLLLRAITYIAIVTIYGVLGWLNFIQAGKLGFLGALAILTVSSWTLRSGVERTFGRIATFVTFLLFAGITGFQAFLRDVFGVANDDIIVIEALFNTDGGEASEFILQNIFYLGKHVLMVLLFAGVYWFVLGWRTRYPRRSTGGVGPALVLPGDSVDQGSAADRLGKVLPYVLTGLLLLVHLNPTTREENPLLYFPIRYAKWKVSLERIEQIQEELEVSLAVDTSFQGLKYASEGPNTVVFVLGESTTRLNWSMYGYSRETTPQLESMGKDLLSFTDIITTAASTVRDIQLIMGPATREDPGLYVRTPDLLTMARQVGYKTFWITNHTTDQTGTLAVIAKHADEIISTNQGGSSGEGSYDDVVLEPLKTALEDPAPLKFVVLHLLGGHPVYYFRYPDPFAVFNEADDEVSRGLKDAGRSYAAVKMRNFYDNAMLYTDHVLKKTIETCEETGQPVEWLFVPDHGEDVAHYTNFVGHNHRVLAMYEIPMLYWRSDLSPVLSAPYEELANRPYQIDLLDHTLLGMLKISGDYYDPAGDILSPEFSPVPRFIAEKPYKKSEN